MFCPKCRAEYREGFHTCSDCNVRLVECLPKPLESPEKDTSGYIRYEEVTGFNNPAIIALVKSILDAHRITYYFNSEFNIYDASAGRLMVRTEQAMEARRLLKTLKV